MSKHTAIVHIPFEAINGYDPSEVANEIVKDIHGQFPEAFLDEVFDDDEPTETANPVYIHPMFEREELECGHGDDFRAIFCIRRLKPDQYMIESVDIQMGREEKPLNIGGVGGELLMDVPVDYRTGAPDIEQMCRDWVGRWHREFVGKTEDSVLGAFYIIRQIITEGKFSND
jgi:hypothetical protein